MNNGSAPDTVTGGKTLELTKYDRVSACLTFIYIRNDKTAFFMHREYKDKLFQYRLIFNLQILLVLH